MMPHALAPIIRPMRRADLDAVVQVQAACYPPSMQEAAPVMLARLEAAGDTCVVAQDHAGVCGYLFAYPGRPGAVTPLGACFDILAGADMLYLHDLAVAPRLHGRGVAGALVAHLLALASAQGFASSALVSVQDSAGFWTARGYRAAFLDCPAARAALDTYPGSAQYMKRALTGPGAPLPSC
ncbi:GNAT family N-acetyltransferase [Telluria aromaticivorans]|nr:GNAT family N-acetyltransferase [Telluria aromaticivorans]